jgi:hypothetical protein
VPQYDDVQQLYHNVAHRWYTHRVVLAYKIKKITSDLLKLNLPVSLSKYFDID